MINYFFLLVTWEHFGSSWKTFKVLCSFLRKAKTLFLEPFLSCVSVYFSPMIVKCNFNLPQMICWFEISWEKFDLEHLKKGWLLERQAKDTWQDGSYILSSSSSLLFLIWFCFLWTNFQAPWIPSKVFLLATPAHFTGFYSWAPWAKAHRWLLPLDLLPPRE